MTSAPSIARVTRKTETGAAAADSLARAFIDDPMFVFLAPDQDQRRRWLQVVQSAHIDLISVEGHTYAACTSSGEVGGAICILPPGRYPMPRPRMWRYELRLVLFPEPWCPPLWSLFRGAPYDPASSSLHPKEPHWFVHTLGVSPDHQSKGLGGLLMERVVELADGTRQPLYLETQNEENLSFYRRFGLEVIGEDTPHTKGPTIFGLLRRGKGRPGGATSEGKEE